MTEILPSQIDYTSRDYQSLRDDLIARMAVAVPEWNPSNPADFGVVLLEAFAHLGDVMSYYIDRAANESALSTATRRASVLALARDLGYEPSGFTPSRVTVTFANTSASPVTVPAETVVTAIVEKDDFLIYVPFTTDEAVTVAASSANTVAATQGETIEGLGYGESLGVSNGAPRQFMRINSQNVVKPSVAVYVFDGVNYYPWQQVTHLSDYAPTSRVFRVIDDGYNGFYVEFGDGVSGSVPQQGHVVYAEYRTAVGTDGNVAANTITEVTSVPGLTSEQVSVLVGTLSVTNELAASGGANPEDLASVRQNAALGYRTNNRAVTLEDYQNLALQVSGCGKASAQSSSPSLVVLTVAPARNSGGAEDRPGYEETSPGVWETTPEYDDLKSRVEEYVDERRLAGVSLSMSDPVYTNIVVALDVTANSGVLNSDVQTLCQQAIVDRFDYTRVGFGASVLETDIIALVSSLGVAETVTVTVLKKDGDPDAVSNLVADEDEIFRLAEADVTVTVTGGA
jgi:hypothetical protein